jgi:hypothetical protein
MAPHPLASPRILGGARHRRREDVARLRGQRLQRSCAQASLRGVALRGLGRSQPYCLGSVWSASALVRVPLGHSSSPLSLSPARYIDYRAAVVRASSGRFSASKRTHASSGTGKDLARVRCDLGRWRPRGDLTWQLDLLAWSGTCPRSLRSRCRDRRATSPQEALARLQPWIIERGGAPSRPVPTNGRRYS